MAEVGTGVTLLSSRDLEKQLLSAALGGNPPVDAHHESGGRHAGRHGAVGQSAARSYYGNAPDAGHLSSGAGDFNGRGPNGLGRDDPILGGRADRRDDHLRVGVRGLNGDIIRVRGERGAASALATGGQPAAASAAIAAAAMGGDGEGEFGGLYTGVLKYYDENKGYGFIDCPEVQEKYGGDVFVHRSQLGNPPVKPMDHVRFTLRFGQKQKPQATDLYKVSAEEGVHGHHLHDPEALYAGKIKYFDSKKGFGFIQCKQIYDIYNTDVFIHQSHLNGCRLRDDVCFRVLLNRQLQPQATDLRPVSEAQHRDGAFIGQGPAAMQPILSTWEQDEKRAHLQPLVSTWEEENGDGDEAGFFRGHIKCFDEDRGFGFIICDEAHEKYKHDVFVHQKQLNGFKPGDAVAFRVNLSRQGKPQATALREDKQAGQLPWGSGDPQDASVEDMMEGVYHQGVIKCFDPERGFGFISCPETSVLYGSDVFVHLRQLNGFSAGDTVFFRVKLNSKKRPQALDVCGDKNAPSGPKPPQERLGGGLEPRSIREPPPAAQKPQVAQGHIKRMDETGKFGIIDSEEIFEQYQSDVIIKSASLLSGLKVGDEVRFEFSVPKVGGLVATSVTKVEVSQRAEGSRSSKEDPLVHRGVIKKIDEVNGFGFISCAETFETYGSDIFVQAKHLKDFSLGDRVIFSVKMDKKLRPQTTRLAHDETPTPKDESLTGSECKGVIKSFNEEAGYGFISCHATHEVYDRDVFLHKTQIGNFKVGDTVIFTVCANDKGHPQAANLKACQKSRLTSDNTGAVAAAFPAGDAAGSSDDPMVAAAASSVTSSPDSVDELLAAATAMALAALAEEDGDGAAASGKQVLEEEFFGELKSVGQKDGYGFITCEELHQRFDRDVFVHHSLFEGLKVGDCVRFRVHVKRGQPQAREVHLVESLGAPASVVERGHNDDAKDVPPAKLNRELMRACESACVDSVKEVKRLLAADADPNSKDVAGMTALMVAALNVRHGEKKCRLLVQHRADPYASYERRGGPQMVLDWARERINADFAAFLEGLARNEDVDMSMALDKPPGDEF